MKWKILIADDEKNAREGLRDALKSSDYRVRLAENAFQAEEILREEAVDLVIADLKMPGMSGLELLKRVQAISPTTLFIIMTAYGTVDTAVQAMKEGASDYLIKPINLDQLEIIIARVLKEKSLEAENIYLKEQLRKQYGFESMIGRSAAMEQVFELIRQIRNSRCTVLISGESGSGKELVARAIHQQSPRKNQPFVAIHCASLAPSLLESELFGHEKGAFTGAVATKKGKFEVAAGGTVFLDEISEIPLEIQVKLLRFLEMYEFERVGGTKPIKVDIRLLAATNADLEKLVGENRFREDLFYRLNVVRLEIAPLRERREDIPLLVRYFIDEFDRENQKGVKSISPRAIHLLQSYDWPGNVRELKNSIESMVVLAKGKTLEVEDLPPNIRAVEPAHLPVSPTFNLKVMGKDMIRKALRETKNNKKKTAELLGMSRRTLYRKLKEYGIR